MFATPTFATEFPHDNPLLSSGALWRHASPLGPARPCRVALAICVAVGDAVVKPTPAASPAIEANAPAVESEAPAIEANASAVASSGPSAEAAAVVEPEAAVEADGFAVYTRALVATLLGEGATRSASVLQEWLSRGRLDAGRLDEPVRQCLKAARFLESDGSDAVTGQTQATLDSWRAVLSGRGSDLSACGDRTLDEWSAALLAALLGRPERSASEIRRALRRAGVAAFGVIDQAA